MTASILNERFDRDRILDWKFEFVRRRAAVAAVQDEAMVSHTGKHESCLTHGAIQGCWKLYQKGLFPVPFPYRFHADGGLRNRIALGTLSHEVTKF